MNESAAAKAEKIEIAVVLLNAARELGETLEPDRVYVRFHELLADVIPHDARSSPRTTRATT